MVKTHNVTGLKYLCKTSTDNPKKPFTYYGSGKHWKRHLFKHGYDISTEILKVCDTKEELVQEGIRYSKIFNVVESKEFANMVEERGDGGPTMLGRSITLEQNEKKKTSLQQFNKNRSPLYRRIRKRINTLCHTLLDNKVYITPGGEFFTCMEAKRALKQSNPTIKRHCLQGLNNQIIDSRWMGREFFMKKTWREIGYNMRDMTTEERTDLKLKLSKYKTLLKRVVIQTKPCSKSEDAI